MIKNYLILFILFVSAFFANSQSAFAQTDTLKVISYNILNGFDWGKDTVRQAKNAGWINKQAPDVVALQELCDYTPERLQKEAAQWGHAHSVLLKTKGYSVGLTSNKPINVVEKLTEGLWHGMLHCETQGIDFFVIHLAPSRPEIRFKEAGIITERVKTTALNPDKCIVLGDYNAPSPFDDEIYRIRQEVPANNMKLDTEEGKQNNLRKRNSDYSVVASFLAIPLIDVCQRYVLPERRYSFPTPILIGTWNTAEGTELRKGRIDYIMATPKLASSCIHATIGNNFETALLSDHYPVIATFVLDSTNTTK